MIHGSLFSGIGGFDLAAQWAGIENKWQVEWDKYCQKVLKKNFPNVKKYHDITKVNGGELEAVDIISGGFPCQPFSQAGKQKGKGDDRYLWPEMLRIIKEVKPKYVIGENVAGIINMELDQVLSDLGSIDYQTECFDIPACSIGALHQRRRIWIIAYSISGRPQKNESQINWEKWNDRIHKAWASFDISRNLPVKWENAERDCPNIRSGNGIPNWIHRIRGLGNAIVPQIAYILFEAIKELEVK